MTKWTEEEVSTLRDMAKVGFTAEEVAKVLGRSAGGVSSAASSRSIEFASSRNAGVRTFLKRGGCVMREDFGGAIGVLWSPAHRGERPERFDTTFLDRLLAMGWLKKAPMASGEVYCRA